MRRRIWRWVVRVTTESPLTLSFSPWKRGRCCTLRALFRRPFSRPYPLADMDTYEWQARQGELAWERDRVRGDSLCHRSTWAAACMALALLAPAPAHAWSLWNEMIEQISIKPQEKPLPFPRRSVPVPGTATMRVQDLDAASALVNPVKPTPESVNAGRQLYGIYCTPCHGASGTGNGLVGEKLSVKPFDLTSDTVQSLSGGFIFGYLSFRGVVMPSYANDLSPTERWHVVNYLRHGLKPPVQQAANQAK